MLRTKKSHHMDHCMPIIAVAGLYSLYPVRLILQPFECWIPAVP